VSYGKATAYLPVIDLLKAYFRIEARDDPRRVREKVSGKLVTLDEALLPMSPAFLALLDVPVEDAPWQGLDPLQRRQRTLDAVRRLLLRESLVQPLLLVFEDLHWIDSETQAVLDALVESLPTTRLLLLVNYRPEYRHGWGGKTYYRQLQVEPLPRASAEELVRTLLGDDETLAPLTRLLIERTGGSPFFLEESVRTLIETKVLAGERGAHRLAQPVERIQVPATVQAVLAARIDRLPPEEKSLLQTAAVIGKDVPFALLQAIGDLSEPEVQRGLAHLQAAEVLYEASLFPEPEYTFKHALTHEVAYASLIHERRRALHARIVEAVEALYCGRLGEQLERLGHHAFRGEVWNKAVPYLRQAGDKATGRSAHPEAVACFEHARLALAHLPDSRDRLEQAVDVLLDLRQSLNALGEIERMNDYLREAEALAQSLGDAERLGQVLVYMAESHRIAGAPARALEVGARALALATHHESLRLKVTATYYLGWAHHDRGAFRTAVEVLSCALRWLDESGLTYARLGRGSTPAVAARWFLSMSLAELGQFTDALVAARKPFASRKRSIAPGPGSTRSRALALSTSEKAISTERSPR
jgi:predicted ATPase